MRTFFLVFLGVFAALGLWELLTNFSPIKFSSAHKSAIEISYVDFVSIMMTGVSVILAALGFVIAILAFIGWSAIGAKVKETAETFLKNSVDDGGELHEAVRKEAREIYRYLGVEAVDTDFNEEEPEK